jgi:hypothetical protein
MRSILLLLCLLAACGGPVADSGDPLAPGPSHDDLLASDAALPGGGTGAPVVTSNNPEIFTGDGVLFSTASSTRGGTPLPLSGRIGVYLHHLNRSGAARRLRVLVESAAGNSAVVRAHGSGYTQADTGGLALGRSPDARVAADWILGRPRTVFGPAQVSQPAAIFDERVPAGSEVDGRFEIDASAPVFVTILAGERVDYSDAPGIVDSPGPGRLGREAGVYAHDTWAGEIALRVAAPGFRRAWRLDALEQAFPALLALADSARTSVGLYGDVYDLRLRLSHDGADARPRRVRISLATAATHFGSRAWDGLWLVDGREVQAQLTAARPAAVLADVALAPGETRALSLRAMVLGLASTPEALVLESH